jgi:GrpB-like predicted nucleotidyltransferase (UPF0157 family)
MLGQHKRNIGIVPYQEAWQAYFAAEAGLLQRASGEKALGIEHIGNTSIPSTAAKPVIDMMVAVPSLKESQELIPVVEALGYQYRPDDPVPERLSFAKECCPQIRTHHLNLTALGSGFWMNQLAFRDYLRAHPEVAQAYMDLKLRLAEVYMQTNEIDPQCKTAFVARVVELAQKEKPVQQRAT